jgi:uncharacterized protein DUF5666
VTFTVVGRTITTDGSTNYQKKTKCGDLREARLIAGEGDVQANGVVLATSVEVIDGGKDN